MKTRPLIAAVIALSAIAFVGPTFADRPSDEPVASSTKSRAGSASMNAYIYDWARPEWIGSDAGASGVAGARYSGRTRAEAKAEMEQARDGGASMNSASRVYIYEWARPEWIGSDMESGAHGVAGSRYSGRTREEVRAEAIEHMKDFKSGSDDMYGR